MFRPVLLSLLTCILPLEAAPGLKDPPASSPPLGRWAVERLIQDGRTREGADVAGWVVVFTRDTCTLEQAGQEPAAERVTFTEAAGVRRMDFTGEGATEPKLAIWKMDGDTLTICEAGPGKERPKDFSASRGSGHSLWVLRRIKN